MLFDIKEKAEKEAYKFGSRGAHELVGKWMPCSINKNNQNV